MEIHGFDGLARHFLQAEAGLEVAKKQALQEIGTAIEADAKAMFGHYQENWPELAPSTQLERERLGYTPNDPLLRSGDLRDLTHVVVDAQGLFVGVTDDQVLAGEPATLVADVHEYGSTDGRVPARPVWGILEHRIDQYTGQLVDEIVKGSGL